jgi:hypothetical protein
MIGAEAPPMSVISLSPEVELCSILLCSRRAETGKTVLFDAGLPQ